VGKAGTQLFHQASNKGVRSLCESVWSHIQLNNKAVEKSYLRSEEGFVHFMFGVVPDYFLSSCPPS